MFCKSLGAVITAVEYSHFHHEGSKSHLENKLATKKVRLPKHKGFRSAENRNLGFEFLASRHHKQRPIILMQYYKPAFNNITQPNIRFTREIFRVNNNNNNTFSS